METVDQIAVTQTVHAPPAQLTPREREVLTLIADGLSTKEAAFRLSLSVKTVETHRERIKAKLNLQSIAHLVKYAIRAGLSTLD